MKRLFLSIAVIAAAVSCSKERISEELNCVSARADDFECAEVFTRTAISREGSNAPAFAWREGDVIGVVPLDGKNKLTLEDDAASVGQGGKWRMPTGAEFQELLDKCRTEWTSLNDVKGIKFTGPNGNSIFLPAAGYRTETGTYLKGLYGYYWSSSLSESKSCNAFCLYFSQYLTFTNNNEINNRCYGQSIRPVSD